MVRTYFTKASAKSYSTTKRCREQRLLQHSTDTKNILAKFVCFFLSHIFSF